MESNQKQAQVVFVAGICWTLAAQSARREERARRIIMNAWLVLWYAAFAIYLAWGAALLQKGDIWGAIFCVVVFYTCGLAIARHAAWRASRG